MKTKKKSSRLIISGRSLLTQEQQATETSVYIEDGKITRVSSGRDPGADLTTEGFIAPGYIDLQLNGAFGYDFTNDGTSVAEVSTRLPMTGVTAFMPTIITSPRESYQQRLREIAAAAIEATGAHVLGVHLEGPFLSPQRKGAHNPDYLRPIDLEEIQGWVDTSIVRIVTLAPELDGALEAIRLLHKAGIVVSIGHSNATFAQAMNAIEAGAGWGTHLFNAMSPFQHREPGVTGALLVSSIPFGLIVDGVHSHPAAVKIAYRVKGPNAIALITDAIEAMGMQPGQYMLGDRHIFVSEDRVQLDDGTLAGSILRMDVAVRNMLAFTGCSLAEAVSMASTTPACLLGLNKKGRLDPGCDADLIILDTDLRVTHTFVSGKLVYEK